MKNIDFLALAMQCLFISWESWKGIIEMPYVNSIIGDDLCVVLYDICLLKIVGAIDESPIFWRRDDCLNC